MTRGNALLLAAMTATIGIAVGCRQDPNKEAYLNVLYSQQRALEDKLNNLDYEHSIAVDELAEERAKNEELLAELGRTDSRAGDSPRTSPRSPARNGARPAPDTNRGDDGSPPALTPPKIEGGTPFDPASGRRRPRAMNTSSAGGPALNELPADARVAHIVLNPYLTQGHDFDGQPGDDGLAIAIEPRNAADEYVPLPGKVSIVVVDPEAGEAGRIARWDFAAEDVAERLAASSGKGIEFKLPWPKTPPTRAQLRVFVRYTAADEQRFEADRPIFLNLPGQFSHRWTPKSSRPIQDGVVEIPQPREAPVERAPIEIPRVAQTPLDPAPVENDPGEQAIETEPPPADEKPAPAKTLERPQWKPFR